MQGCNLLESGTDFKVFFSPSHRFCLKFSKYATAECELSFVVQAETGPQLCAVPPLTHYFLAKTGP